MNNERRWIAVEAITRAVTDEWRELGNPPTRVPWKVHHEVTAIGEEVEWLRGVTAHVYIHLGMVRKLDP